MIVLLAGSENASITDVFIQIAYSLNVFYEAPIYYTLVSSQGT